MGSLEDRVARLEQRLANLNPRGPVVERDHAKGVRLNLGTAEKPFLSDWVQPGDRTGASRYLPEIGEQLMLMSDGGDWSQATTVPYTHSKARENPAADIDETVHHARDGQRHSVKKGHVKDKADRKHTRSTGSEDASAAGGNVRHELNKQLQGIRATLTQHDNNIAGLHDATSKLRQIAQVRIPELASLTPFLSGDAASLEKAAQGVLGKLEAYVAKTFEQAVGKLTNGFMDNVMGIVAGVVSGRIEGVLDQVADLAAEHDLDGLVGGVVVEARGMVAGAVAGNVAPLSAKLDQIGGLLAGTPAEAAFEALSGQMSGVLGPAREIAASLGGLVDGQKNLTKGLTKSYRLGGYDGDE